MTTKESLIEFCESVVDTATFLKGRNLTKQEKEDLLVSVLESKKRLEEGEDPDTFELDILDVLPDDYLLSALTEEDKAGLTGSSDVNTILGNKGVLIDKGDTWYDVKPENLCPYFRTDGLCLLDGRICQYDTQSFPVCHRYKQGLDDRIAGMNGKVPDIPPETKLPNPNDDNQGA